MSSRKIVAYALIALILVAAATWAWWNRRNARAKLRRRHGPRPDQEA